MSTGAAKGWTWLHYLDESALLAALGHNMFVPPKASTCNNWQWRIAPWGASGFATSGRRRFAERRDLGGYLLLKLGPGFCWFLALTLPVDSKNLLADNLLNQGEGETWRNLLPDVSPLT